MSETRLIVEATLAIYLQCAREASRVLLRNWIFIPASFLLVAAWVGALFLLGGFGQSGGMILGVIEIALITLYYVWVSSAVDKEKLTTSSLLSFDWGIFLSLIGVAFVFSILDLVLYTPLSKMPELAWVPACLNLALFVLLNAVPEAIHQHRYDTLPALSCAFRFNKENWIEWYAPLIVLLLPGVLQSGTELLLLPTSMDVLLPISFLIKALNTSYPVFGFDIGALVWQLVLVCAGSWFIFFRAFLFRELEHGTRRRRVYQMRQRG